MQIRTPRQEDFQTIATLQNQHYLNLWNTTPEDMFLGMTRTPQVGRLVAVKAEQVQAYAQFEPSEVASVLHVRFYADGASLEARSMLLEAIMAGLPSGITQLESTLREDFAGARKFLEHAGFQNTFQSYGAHLDLQNFDFAPFEGLEERLFIEGFEIQTTPPAPSTALYDLYCEAYTDVPQVPATRWEKPSQETFERMLWKDNHVWFTVLYRGQVVALTVLELSKTGLESHLTLTSRKFRHRGLATLVKARSLQWAREQGHLQASTGGAVINLGMLKVNRRLGYQIEPMWLTYTRPVSSKP